MDFVKIIAQPLGLAGFALALVFGISGIFAKKQRARPNWLPAVAVTLAAVCLIGGMFLSYSSLKPQPPPIRPVPPQQVSEGNTATTLGDCGPALAGVVVGGSVNTTCNGAPNKPPRTSDK